MLFFYLFRFFSQNVIIQLQKCLGTRDLHRRKIQTFNLTTIFEQPCITLLVLNSGDLEKKGANVHIWPEKWLIFMNLSLTNLNATF